MRWRGAVAKKIDIKGTRRFSDAVVPSRLMALGATIMFFKSAHPLRTAVKFADIMRNHGATHQATESKSSGRQQLGYTVETIMAIFLDCCRGTTFSYIRGGAELVAGRSLRFLRIRSSRDARSDAVARHRRRRRSVPIVAAQPSLPIDADTYSSARLAANSSLRQAGGSSSTSVLLGLIG